MPVTKLQEPVAGKGQRGILWQYVVWAIKRINRTWQVKMKPFTGQVLIDESETTITLDFTHADFGAASDAAPIPWGLLKISETEIRVVYGDVVTPDGTFTPSGFNPGDDPTFVLTVSGDGVVYFWVTIDNTTGETLTAEDPESDTALPANTATEFYLQLGSFSTDGDSILHVQTNDLGTLYFELCGGVAPVWGGFRGI